MKLAFILNHYFPHGGLQRDFLRIAKACQQQGHQIDIYCMEWSGDIPTGFQLHCLGKKGISNHQRIQNFIRAWQQSISNKNYDCIIGFNKMPGLDIYYAADPCLAQKAKLLQQPWLKLFPRYKKLLQLEADVFSAKSHCQILSISPKEKLNYQKSYHTANHRFIELPPGVSRNRIPPENVNEIRQQYREQFQLKQNDFALLSIGSSFNTKGIDRALHAIASLPATLKMHCHYFVAGKEKHLSRYEKLAKKLNLAEQVHFLQARDDIPELLWMSDLLLHPARTENTGTAIVEALVAQLPVIATATCGYAFYVTESKAGYVLDEPFTQKQLDHDLAKALAQLPTLKQYAKHYEKRQHFFDLIEEAANYINHFILDPLANARGSVPSNY